MAMAARRERGLLDPDAAPGESVFDHTIWAICSDGDLEEGVSAEVSSLAGTQRLGNLVLVWDDNRISIEDDTSIAFTEDVAARYEAYGWHVQRVSFVSEDGSYVEDVEALAAALEAAQAERERPSFIALRTVIGWPAPNKQGSGKAHGAALGKDEVAATKTVMGLDPDATFSVPDDVLQHARSVVQRGRESHARWQERYDAWAAANPDGLALHHRLQARRLPDGWATALPVFEPSEKGVATRKASGEVLNALAPVLPELWGGSADLAESNNTTMEGEPSFLPEDRGSKMFPGHPFGRTLHFGIREHGMGSIMNGIALHGGTRVYGGTFLVFSDYMRGAVRLAALMGLPVTYVWTHDSIGLGEDGPTHQPVEHLASLRAVPGPGRRAPRRRQRDGRRLAHDPGAHRPPGRPVPDPPERPDLRPLGVRQRRGRRAGRVRPARREHRPARGHPDGHRLRGADLRRGAGAARGRGPADARGLDALRRVVPAAGRGLQAHGAAERRARARVRRGRRLAGLARVGRRGR
jgi:transketolase